MLGHGPVTHVERDSNTNIIWLNTSDYTVVRNPSNATNVRNGLVILAHIANTRNNDANLSM